MALADTDLTGQYIENPTMPDIAQCVNMAKNLFKQSLMVYGVDGFFFLNMMKKMNWLIQKSTTISSNKDIEDLIIL